MKFLFAITFMTLAVMMLGTNVNAKYCPGSRPNCVCTADYQPVCSTRGCTYGNRCWLCCAGEKWAYDGECVRP